MRTDEIIKEKFLVEVLTYEGNKIKYLQETAAREFGLEDLLENDMKYLKGHFDVQASETGARLTLRCVKHIRYADIGLSRKRGLYIYNRIVFGRLYRYTMNKIRYGFLDTVKERLIRELEQAGYNVNNPSNTHFLSEYYD
jgi:hypothetical protein